MSETLSETGLMRLHPNVLRKRELVQDKGLTKSFSQQLK